MKYTALRFKSTQLYSVLVKDENYEDVYFK